PILENDTAREAFTKVTVAAELVLHRALPKLINGSAKLTPQDLTQGSYFGRRTPADGIINWHDTAENIHNLVRAVGSPYPGAWTDISGQRVYILRIVHENKRSDATQNPRLYVEENEIYADCADGKALRILTLKLGDKILTPQSFQQQFGQSVQLV